MGEKPALGPDSFTKAVCQDLTPSWINALTGGQEYQQWHTLQEYLSLEDNMELHHRFFFGDAKTSTPPFTGYTIGYNIIREFLKKRPDIRHHWVWQNTKGNDTFRYVKGIEKL